MTLEDVVEIVFDVLSEIDIQTNQSYPGRTIEKITLIRETCIEHLAIPDLPVELIVRRLITGLMTEEESAFWAQQFARRHR